MSLIPAKYCYPDNLVPHIQRTAPQRLPNRSLERHIMAKPSVLFVCVHNAGRSQMAAGYLIHLAGDTIKVRSAGPATSRLHQSHRH
ncbi:uncharacterized protein ASPGLDRAFT_1468146 [Aspergillus glaucus CBS 516.65]|uniref:Phosphotyrosine protein phosphatase I domain-containing protein n=1 Tax=Aspergillus glaucus CBS 516.65 TaxID=1160497 RepID=A0A1L9VLC1_ASPGL|nr:hypothetical protein ASPGLDRAFT_1468146 [Aspergillus glaucus CBS 516.65]OJJ84727.1 hypothetical protein ASPGLDRAFT_1468146 [Aspergillus glaucus CBS 516.65]